MWQKIPEWPTEEARRAKAYNQRISMPIKSVTKKKKFYCWHANVQTSQIIVKCPDVKDTPVTF